LKAYKKYTYTLFNYDALYDGFAGVLTDTTAQQQQIVSKFLRRFLL